MYREILSKLGQWKDKTTKKPLIIAGARQVGKTWVMKEFARQKYTRSVYINFDNTPEYSRVFDPDLDTSRIIKSLSALTHTAIEPDNTLIILDEIQECNRALASLKYFCENAPQYQIIAAGSFLGVTMHAGSTFPVGKVEIVTLYPMTFAEYLRGIGETAIADALYTLDMPMISGLRDKIIELLKQYYYVGGMPEVVASFAAQHNPETVREIQRTIVRSYQADFSKHINSSDIPKTSLIWDSVPAQLAREKKKFLYKDIKPGARAREYENALTWLVQSGLVYKLNRVSLPSLPLTSYAEQENFKLFMLDIGLLSCKASLDWETLQEPGTPANHHIFTHFKGALTEQYVLQELKAYDDSLPLYYWANEKNTVEIDFLVQKWNRVIPLEVKSGENLKAKSLKAFIAAHSTQTAIRTSLAEYAVNDPVTEIPLYLIGQFEQLVSH
jgi:predicted AAA+ superfamily ATPase